MPAPATPTKPTGTGPYWALRAIESALLLAMLVGIGLFAYSLVDIVRIETAAIPTKALPPSAWPGVFLFGGGLILLQVVRAVLVRYRRDDGTPRGDARGVATAATAEALADLDGAIPEEPTNTGNGA